MSPRLDACSGAPKVARATPGPSKASLGAYHMSVERRGFDMEQAVITTDPQIQGGVPVFGGTRVPVKNLFDYLEAGDSLDQFLADFPSVQRDAAVAVLEQARAAVASCLTSHCHAVFGPPSRDTKLQQ